VTLSVSVLAPGLAERFTGYAADAFAVAPALSRLLSRSQRRRFAARSLEAAALFLFGRGTGKAALPVAPYSYLGENGQPPEGYCLRADPVHLQVDARGLILFDVSTFPFSEQEAEALAETVADFLIQDGWRLDASHTRRWYLCGGSDQQLTTLPLSQVCGKSVGELLPLGKDAADWLSRCNEIQMLMYAHPVNQQRASRSLPIVNSLWIWGGGVLEHRHTKRYSKVFANDVFIRGLAMGDGVLCEPEPRDAEALLQSIGKGDRVLLVLDDCAAPAAYADFQRWNATLSRYEQQWFAPLLRAVSRRQLEWLELIPLNGYRYHMAFRQAWRLWKRSQAYQEILGHEATD
jgi:hypothetical protein